MSNVEKLSKAGGRLDQDDSSYKDLDVAQHPSTLLNNESPNNIQVVHENVADDTSAFYNKYKDTVGELTPEEEKRLTKKNFWRLMVQTWWIAFLIHLDKSTLSSASTMGIFDDIDMTKNQYNDLFVVFYAGYLIALWPGSYLSQRIGHKYFITGSLALWALILGVHPAAKTGQQLMALRFLLGMTESQIVPSTAILHQAFFDYKRSPWIQMLWWASGSLANVLLTMIAYKLILDDNAGTLPGGLSSWKWLHFVCVILTFLVFLPLLYWLPNSPVDAKWLTIEEKVHTIAMIRKTHSGVRNSSFSWNQVKECFTDIKTWLFIFHMFFNELPNNTSQQIPLLIVGFGFTPAESALFNIAKPIWGSLLLAAPRDNKIALVVGTQISTFKPSYLLALSWAGLATTGYTKKMITMSTCVVAAAVANMIAPEFWKAKYRPYYTLPWSFMTAFWIISPTMCVIIRLYLQRENKRRQAILEEKGDFEEDAAKINMETLNGVVQINDWDLDLTDRQNKKFIYPL
ncbi:hypothetical protein L486_05732 [Kwoniella mangroviensis CBS 10435]|uniref:Major facilitator superfamily (MFS) profile domain-containing protein n=1 Tax=Kwoniella mangroviensis CBS 10435 TaxID=1331196 RepID=A0A1B9IMX5_9TREE|nr:hypothetical protein L486_05732 [Kwoniella mangroviensis CBS 10435]OCF75447.1 hypothetical protein I204_04302 [Kwoniella mangroviensis CBS 8886]